MSYSRVGYTGFTSPSFLQEENLTRWQLQVVDINTLLNLTFTQFTVIPSSSLVNDVVADSNKEVIKKSALLKQRDQILSLFDQIISLQAAKLCEIVQRNAKDIEYGIGHLN
jgi:hypothetical protein